MCGIAGELRFDRRPADLAGHSCLRFTKAGTAVRTTWPFGRGKRAVEVPVNGRLVSDDFVVLRRAAERGLDSAADDWSFADVARLPEVEAAVVLSTALARLEAAGDLPDLIVSLGSCGSWLR